MRIIRILFISVLAVLGIISCQRIEDESFPEDQLIERKDFILTRSELNFIQENNSFAIDLFKRVAVKEAGKSTLISPLSVTIDFGMVNNGAVGETREEINRVLGFKEDSVDTFNAFCQSMLVQSAKVDPSTILDMANAAVVNKLYVPLKEDFSKTIRSLYDAEVIYKEFGKDDVKGLINKWCSEKTHGMIPELLKDQPDHSEYAHFLNALYFKGIWSNRFDKKDTKKESFICGDGSRMTVNMMWQKDNFNYGGISDICTTLCLPYGNQAYRMIILLPIEGKTIEDVKNTLNGEVWRNMMKGMSGAEVDVKLPVFETATDVLRLRDVLMDMGIRKAFGIGGADFSGMSEVDLYIGDVFHKARIKVDETGSEAAAVTDIVMMVGAGPSPDVPSVVEFHCDRPFLFAITEVSSGAIYFMGQYTGK